MYRLTVYGCVPPQIPGAGWGGCTVSLVPEDKVGEFIQRIKETYPPYKGLEGDALNEVIFATKPGRGACGKRDSSSKSFIIS